MSDEKKRDFQVVLGGLYHKQVAQGSVDEGVAGEDGDETSYEGDTMPDDEPQGENEIIIVLDLEDELKGEQRKGECGAVNEAENEEEGSVMPDDEEPEDEKPEEEEPGGIIQCSFLFSRFQRIIDAITKTGESDAAGCEVSIVVDFLSDLPIDGNEDAVMERLNASESEVKDIILLASEFACTAQSASRMIKDENKKLILKRVEERIMSAAIYYLGGYLSGLVKRSAILIRYCIKNGFYPVDILQMDHEERRMRKKTEAIAAQIGRQILAMARC